MAPSLGLLILVLSVDTDMPQWPWYSCLGSAVACVWLTGAAGVISSRRCRFIFLTTTLQMSLVPFYAGIWLGMTTPIVTCFLFLALGTLLAFIRGSIYVSIRMCGRSTHVRRRRLSRNQRVLAKKHAKACRKEQASR